MVARALQTLGDGDGDNDGDDDGGDGNIKNSE